MVERALDESGAELELMDLSEVPDDAFVIPTAMMGAPTCIVEKLPNAASSPPRSNDSNRCSEKKPMPPCPSRRVV